MNYGILFKKKLPALVWLAVDRERNQVINFSVGCRASITFNPLWQRVKACLPTVICTDYWRPYVTILPRGLHVQGKAETYTVGGINVQIRHSLARFRRKIFCYLKLVKRVHLSLKLLFTLDFLNR